MTPVGLLFVVAFLFAISALMFGGDPVLWGPRAGMEIEVLEAAR